MDHREMEYFRAIAENGNLTRAAAQVYVGQPTLSKFMNRVETEAGVPLFEKIGRKIGLTAAGKVYLQYVNRVLELDRDLRRELDDLRRMEKGVLRVGMPPFRYSFLVPHVMADFKAAYPEVELSFTEETSTELDRRLIKGEIDLALYNCVFRNEAFSYIDIMEEKMFAILPKGHPIEKRAVPGSPGMKAICPEWLADETFIVQNPEQRQGQFIRAELQARGFEPRKIMESSNIRAAASLAASGCGVAFLTRGLEKHFHCHLEYDAYEIADCKTKISFSAAYRSQYMLPQYAKYFLELVKKVSLS